MDTHPRLQHQPSLTRANPTGPVWGQKPTPNSPCHHSEHCSQLEQPRAPVAASVARGDRGHYLVIQTQWLALLVFA